MRPRTCLLSPNPYPYYLYRRNVSPTKDHGGGVELARLVPGQRDPTGQSGLLGIGAIRKAEQGIEEQRSDQRRRLIAGIPSPGRYVEIESDGRASGEENHCRTREP